MEHGMQGLDNLKYDANGLIPAIIQDADTGEVLMMAYMNKHSLDESLRTGKTHFWSRSRQKYCHEGYKNCFFRKFDASTGQWSVCAERLVNPDEVYGKK
jgi:phosphoribosyl-AMP cyclohydrolase